MEIQLSHSLTYTNHGRVPIAEVAQSLLANETLLQHGVAFLEHCFPDLKIEKAEVTLRKITHESPLSEVFAVALFATFQKGLEKEVPHMIEQLTGHHVAKEYHTVLTVIVFMLTYHGVELLYKKVFPGKNPPKTQKALADAISVTGLQLHVGVETIKACLEKFNPTEKHSLAKAARDFLIPAKREAGASVLGQGGATISREVIDELPDDIAMLEDEDNDEIIVPYDNVVIQIRATDIDHNKTGWGGIVGDLHDKRLRMAIYPTIDLKGMYGKQTVRGDILLVSKRQIDGTYKPTMFHLIKLHSS